MVEVFGTKAYEVKGSWQNYLTRFFAVYNGHLALGRLEKSIILLCNRWWLGQKWEVMLIKCLWVNILENSHLEDERRWNVDIKMELTEPVCEVGSR
jgi:hypothetical protein